MSRGQLGVLKGHYDPVLSSSNVPVSPSLVPCRGRVCTHMPMPKPPTSWGLGSEEETNQPEPDYCLFLPSAHDPYVVCNAPTTCWKPQEQPCQGKLHGKGKRAGPATPWTFSSWCGCWGILKPRENKLSYSRAGTFCSWQSCRQGSFLASLMTKERPHPSLPK